MRRSDARCKSTYTTRSSPVERNSLNRKSPSLSLPQAAVTSTLEAPCILYGKTFLRTIRGSTFIKVAVQTPSFGECLSTAEHAVVNLLQAENRDAIVLSKPPIVLPDLWHRRAYEL